MIILLVSGEDISEFLLKAVINFTPESDCRNGYNTDSKLRAGFDPSSMVCAGDKYSGHDTCSVKRYFQTNS